tara:strand:- start:400 stop:504 length:105 start_codon:yes stop_codon:yes gene_type:complete
VEVVAALLVVVAVAVVLVDYELVYQEYKMLVVVH